MNGQMNDENHFSGHRFISKSPKKIFGFKYGDFQLEKRKIFSSYEDRDCQCMTIDMDNAPRWKLNYTYGNCTYSFSNGIYYCIIILNILPCLSFDVRKTRKRQKEPGKRKTGKIGGKKMKKGGGRSRKTRTRENHE